LDYDDADGITVTSGAMEIRIGEATELDQKAAFLAALARTGKTYSLIDVRYVDAPSYQ
jgi:chlorophyllide a reductase subunit X